MSREPLLIGRYPVAIPSTHRLPSSPIRTTLTWVCEEGHETDSDITAATVVGFAFVGRGESTGPIVIDFDWSGVVDQGDVIEIKGINGDINASITTGNEVVVTVQKEGDRSDPATVDIEVVIHTGGVTICAVYPDVPGQPPNECAPADQSPLNNQDNDLEVTFTVAVPAGVEFVGETIDGSVTGTNLQSDAFAFAVNGDGVVSTTDPPMRPGDRPPARGW